MQLYIIWFSTMCDCSVKVLPRAMGEFPRFARCTIDHTAAVKSATSAVVDGFVGQALDFVKEHPVTSVAIGSLAGFTTAYLFKEKLRKVSYRLRGIQGESARPGSCIVKGEEAWPGCQVLLYEAGAVWSTFLGCGVRVGDYLVTYSHVVQDVGQVVIRTKKGYFLLNTGRVASMRLPDVSYYQLSPAEWSTMGVVSANTRPVAEQMALRAQPAMVWSKAGYTQGILAPLHLGRMKMEYSGTTEPGFSGAPYMGGPANSQVLGLHQGVQEGHNVGFIWYAILEDIRMTFNEGKTLGESNYRGPRSGGDDQGRVDMAAQYLRPSRTGAWTYKGMADQLALMDNGTSGWAAEEDDFDWGATLDFETKKRVVGVDGVIETMEDMSQETLEAVRHMAEALIAKKRVTSGQSPDTPVVDGGESWVAAVTKASQAYTDAKVAALEKRVAELEEMAMAGKAKPTRKETTEKKEPPRNPFPCDGCERSFKTREGLAAHRVTMHKERSEVQGERKGKTAFLGGKKQSPSYTNWRKRSSSVDRFPLSQVTPASQPSLEATLRQLCVSLESALKTMAGQNSAAGPSSKA